MSVMDIVLSHVAQAGGNSRRQLLTGTFRDPLSLPAASSRYRCIRLNLVLGRACDRRRGKELPGLRPAVHLASCGIPGQVLGADINDPIKKRTGADP